MRKGFTLIELLVTIAIISLIVTIGAFALREAQKSGRDGRRKADLENIAIALELYRSDCNTFPSPSSNRVPSPLGGTGTPSSCNGTYLSQVPADPQSPSRDYFYSRPTATSYVLCAALESAPNPPVNTSGCGSCGQTCNWKVARP